jgi:hypothetical protein
MTLGGLLKHLAHVEDWWCSWWLWGRDLEAPWASVDWDTDPDWDWHSAAEDTPEEIHALWQGSVTRSRTLVADALAEGGLERLAKRAERWDGRSWSMVLAGASDTPPSLRWILCHLIEEYARHIGRADLICGRRRMGSSGSRLGAGRQAASFGVVQLATAAPARMGPGSRRLGNQRPGRLRQFSGSGIRGELLGHPLLENRAIRCDGQTVRPGRCTDSATSTALHQAAFPGRRVR